MESWRVKLSNGLNTGGKVCQATFRLSPLCRKETPPPLQARPDPRVAVMSHMIRYLIPPTYQNPNQHTQFHPPPRIRATLHIFAVNTPATKTQKVCWISFSCRRS